MGSLSGIEILIVTDSTEVLAQLRKVLDPEGAWVSDARTARSALSAALELHPHLVICDLALLGHGAFIFLREFRASLGFAHTTKTPVLALGDARSREGIVQATQLGATDCVLKPLQALLIAAKAEKLAKSAIFPKRVLAASEGTIAVPMEIMRAGESGFVIESPIVLGPDSEVKLESALIDRLGLGAILMRTGTRGPFEPASVTPPRSETGQVADIGLIGVDPKSAKALRELASGGEL
jgi:CheY-like chemotaxis protein